MVVAVLPRAYAADPPPWIFQCDVDRLLVSVGGRERGELGVERYSKICRTKRAIVLVHDAARPLVTDDTIDRVIAGARGRASARSPRCRSSTR